MNLTHHTALLGDRESRPHTVSLGGPGESRTRVIYVQNVYNSPIAHGHINKSTRHKARPSRRDRIQRYTMCLFGNLQLFET
jgi:hypothetical protein